MKRPRFPSPPAGVKLTPNSLRNLAWYIKRRENGSLYETKPNVGLHVDGYWTSTITVSALNWKAGGKAKINYSSGGSNDSDNFEYLQNFIAGLQYAVVLAEWMEQFYTYIERTLDNSDEVA